MLGSISNYDDDAKDNVDYKMNLYIFITRESRDILKSLVYFYCRSCLESECATQLKIQNINFKIIPRGSRCPQNPEFGHFTLLFCKGRQRNVPWIITYVQSHFVPYQIKLLFSDVPVAVLVFLKLPIMATELIYLRHLSLISELAEAVIFWTINAWKSYQRINFRGVHPFHWGKLLWHPSTGQGAKKSVARLIPQRHHKTVTVNPASHSSLYQVQNYFRISKPFLEHKTASRTQND